MTLSVRPAQPLAQRPSQRQAQETYGADWSETPGCTPMSRGELDSRPRIPGRLAEPAVLDFLKPVSESKDKQIAADPWRITVVQPAPFETQFLKSERTDAIELALDRPRIHAGHG